jgi:hypothetical protein
MSAGSDNNAMVSLNALFGHVEIVTTERREGSKLLLGGYAIYYGADGKETGRTQNSVNIVVELPDDMYPRRRWWEFWK